MKDSDLINSFKEGDTLICTQSMFAHWGSIFSLDKSYTIYKISNTINVVRDYQLTLEINQSKTDEIKGEFGRSNTFNDHINEKDIKQYNEIERKWSIIEMENNIEVDEMEITIKGDDDKLYHFVLYTLEDISDIYNNGNPLYVPYTRHELRDHFDITHYVRDVELDKLI